VPQLDVGVVIRDRLLTTVQDRAVPLPEPGRLVHVQFRRYAGCPICNLHLRDVARRHDEITDAGVTEIVVFHSSRDALLDYQADQLPFSVVPDPDKDLYAEFGVTSSPRALLDPRAWLAFGRSVAESRSLRGSAGGGEQHLGLPADFLVDPAGAVLARKYGAHAGDQWSVEEILSLARAHHL